MESNLRLKIVEDNSYSGKKILRIGLTYEDVINLILTLSLLNHNMIDEILFYGDNSKLYVSRDKQLLTQVVRRGCISERNKITELHISDTELEYWLDFLLRTYRDGIDEPDHIDTEITHIDKALNYRRFYLTFNVSGTVK